MKAEEFWKNFNLGTELDISGRFLYDGLYAFHLMENFTREEDAFEVLYSVAVGVERLIKIALILSNHDKSTDREAFESELITHSHQELLYRLAVSHPINIGKVHHDFVAMLADFYKSSRYGRYSLASAAAPTKERDDLIAFLEKHLHIEIDVTTMFGVTKNNLKIRKFFGKVVSKIALPIYKIIYEEAGRLKLYTYEVQYGTKASKIFTFKRFDFFDEDILQAELLTYFMSDKASGPNSQLLREEAEALPFDPAEEQDYMLALRSERKKLMILDQLDALYEEHVSDVANRLELMRASYFSLDFPFEDEGEEDS
ncbi:hypothetical protein [Parvibaculum sp.]|uniref:hypothetical protein n=1 Tax=Parvibaculum sp. TaxID=2024848 RepID=UPI001D74A760|nr:hypothetical protein [Parvibaculum sp.]MBX3490501.1 hypothetical protein [Parvibaculum sp.]